MESAARNCDRFLGVRPPFRSAGSSAPVNAPQLGELLPQRRIDLAEPLQPLPGPPEAPDPSEFGPTGAARDARHLPPRVRRAPRPLSWPGRPETAPVLALLIPGRLYLRSYWRRGV
jgi:hypothetical protein